MSVQTLLLPFTGYRLQWRADRFWRAFPPAQWRHADDDPASWGAWTAADGLHAIVGDNDGRDEWAVWGGFGEMPAGGVGEVAVHLPGGAPVRIRHLGQLWACEWTVPHQLVDFVLDGQYFRVSANLSVH